MENVNENVVVIEDLYDEDIDGEFISKKTSEKLVNWMDKTRDKRESVFFKSLRFNAMNEANSKDEILIQDPEFPSETMKILLSA